MPAKTAPSHINGIPILAYTAKTTRGRAKILVECPECNKPRWIYKHNAGPNFTGVCAKCRIKFICVCTDKSNGYTYWNWKSPSGRYINVSEHRIVMEQHLGRELTADENVHHKNGVRDDNRLENLELWNTSQPAGQLPEDKVEYAKAILRLYEPGALTGGSR